MVFPNEVIIFFNKTIYKKNWLLNESTSLSQIQP